MLLRRSWATRAVKLKSERRRAKRSPSFILVVGRSPDPAFGVVLRESGRYSPRGESRRSSTARSSRNAFSSDWRRQYSRAMRPRTPCRGNFLAPCIPEGASDGKRAPPWQHIAAVHPKRAGFGKICAPCIRKAPQTAFRECIARRSCQGGALFAALTPRIIHGARILPSRRRCQTARTPATPAPRPHRVTAGIGSSISGAIRAITVSLVRHAACV